MDGENKAIALKDGMEEWRKPAFRFRRLKAEDLFLMIRIVNKIGISELVSCMDSPQVMGLIQRLTKKGGGTEGSEGGAESAVNGAKGKVSGAEGTGNGTKGTGNMPGADDASLIVGAGVALAIADKLLGHLPACKADLYGLLGNVAGMAAEDVAELDAEVFVEMLVAFIRKEEFPNFIKVASKYFK